MTSDSSGQRRQSDRRRLFDRRSPIPRRARADRRDGERRVLTLRVTPDRRTGTDRRVTERRAADDRRVNPQRRHLRRRRETPTPYTPEELAQVRAAFAQFGQRPTCPVCGGVFALGRPRPRGTDTVRRVQCRGCGKAAIVANSRAVRVLLIEPKPQLRETIRQMLAQVGHEVIEAAESGVGLRAYEERPPDVVLLDVTAPGRLAAGDFMRNLHRAFPDARVVAMAGRPSYGVVDPAAVTQRLGAARTVRLPFAADDLLRAIEDARL